MADIHVRIRDLRKRHKWTQEELAAKVGSNKTTISYYETGSRTPDADMLQKFADLFEVSVDYLLGRSTTPVSYSEGERMFLKDLENEELTPEDLMNKYNLKIGDHAATPEEVEDMVSYIKAKRIMKLMKES